MNVFKTKRSVLSATDGRRLEIEVEEKSISISISNASYDDSERMFIFNKAELAESPTYRSEIKSLAKELLALVDASTPPPSKPYGY